VWPWQEAKSSGKTLTNLLKCVAPADAERTTFRASIFFPNRAITPAAEGVASDFANLLVMI
jgi:hypothetical protein